MAKFAFKDSSDYAIRLGRIADAAEEGRIAQKALYEAAGIVTDRIRANLRSVISGDATGDLEKSITENREMVNHYCYFMIWMQKALA